jgi:hypothetical protein
VRRNTKGFRELTISQDDHVMLGLLDNSPFVQQLRCDFLVGLKVLFQGRNTYFQPALLEDVGKPAFRQPTMKRHLASLKTNLTRVT